MYWFAFEQIPVFPNQFFMIPFCGVFNKIMHELDYESNARIALGKKSHK